MEGKVMKVNFCLLQSSWLPETGFLPAVPSDMKSEVEGGKDKHECVVLNLRVALGLDRLKEANSC